MDMASMEAPSVMGGASPPHDHSAHASGDHMGTGVIRNADGTYAYSHGAYLGHIVPGSFFVIWGVWWTISLFLSHIQALSRRHAFRSRPWHPVPFGSAKVRQLPIEPIIKIVLPLIGIAGELRLGHSRYQALHDSNGMFDLETIRDWQHSTMYLAFVASGVADIVSHVARLPRGIPWAFLALSFIAEGVLLVFHLKGPSIEIHVHLILVLQIFATAIATIGEAMRPTSFIAACLRPYWTMVQGAWWIQTAFIMYRSAPAWDPDYMGAAMMAPVVCTVHLILIGAGMLLVYACARAFEERRLGGALESPRAVDEEGGPRGGIAASTLELAALTGENGRVKPRY